jgi:hypothetical protein
MRMEGLGQLLSSSGIKPATFGLLAQCINQLLSRVPKATVSKYF